MLTAARGVGPRRLPLAPWSQQGGCRSPSPPSQRRRSADLHPQLRVRPGAQPASLWTAPPAHARMPSEEKACDGPRLPTPLPPHLKEREAAKRPGSAGSPLSSRPALGSALFQSTCCSPAQPGSGGRVGRQARKKSWSPQRGGPGPGFPRTLFGWAQLSSGGPGHASIHHTRPQRTHSPEPR